MFGLIRWRNWRLAEIEGFSSSIDGKHWLYVCFHFCSVFFLS